RPLPDPAPFFTSLSHASAPGRLRPCPVPPLPPLARLRPGPQSTGWGEAVPAGGNEAERRGREPGAGLGAGEKQRGRGRPRQLGPAVPLLGGAWERSRWRGCPLVSCPASRAAAALRPSTCERRSCGHLEEATGEELPGAPRAVAGFSSPLSASSHHEETPGTRLLPRRPRAVPGALCPRCRAGPRPPRPPHPAAAAPGRAAQAGARALQECPSSIRKRIAATEFGAAFLATVPVLQWAQHAREEEYRRLRRYAGAHGWKNVSWDVLKASLSLLNTSASGLLSDSRQASAPCVRCAVVGNGGILNGSRMGPAIDAHHHVFRVNGAITAGFERDVGNRTSFYVFSTNTMMNSLSSYAADGFKHPPQTPETCYVFLPDHDRDYLLLRAALTRQRVDRGRDKGAWPQDYFGQDLRAEKFRMLHPDFIRYLRNR
uniref:alpha-N-acetylgalactosaminide alpha-2,6-sialyltransferase n=1 Tax=Anser cygnoides TaxID=8845 RepID=A0A8B9EHZ6_ANSCY